MGTSVCLFAAICQRRHAQTSRDYLCFLTVAILCTSGLVDDVTFAYNWPSKGDPNGIYSKWLTSGQKSYVCHFLVNRVRDTTHNNDRFTALCPGLPGWAGTRRNTHPPTILIIVQSLSASIYHDPLHPPCSNYVLGNLYAQPLSMSSLVYPLVWSPPPHIAYSSPRNHCLLFATHAHTIA